MSDMPVLVYVQCHTDENGTSVHYFGSGATCLCGKVPTAKPSPPKLTLVEGSLEEKLNLG